jgi:hypothetical protein
MSARLLKFKPSSQPWPVVHSDTESSKQFLFIRRLAISRTTTSKSSTTVKVVMTNHIIMNSSPILLYGRFEWIASWKNQSTTRHPRRRYQQQKHGTHL